MSSNNLDGKKLKGPLYVRSGCVDNMPLAELVTVIGTLSALPSASHCSKVTDPHFHRACQRDLNPRTGKTTTTANVFTAEYVVQQLGTRLCRIGG